MIDTKDKQEKESAGTSEVVPEREVAQQEQGSVKTPEAQETLRDNEAVSAELKRSIELMGLEPGMEKDAEKEREKIGFLGEEEKLDHLLKMAREKGPVYAVRIASKMGDPFILDTLHDTLSKQGYYKGFVK